jgi:hypothetical protein
MQRAPPDTESCQRHGPQKVRESFFRSGFVLLHPATTVVGILSVASFVPSKSLAYAEVSRIGVGGVLVMWWRRRGNAFVFQAIYPVF